MSSKFLNANTDVNLSANSDSQIPSQKAVKTYVDNKTSVLATKEELTEYLKTTDAQNTYSKVGNTVSDVVAGSSANQINVTKGGSTKTLTINNVANATTAGKVEATVAAGSDLDIVRATVASSDYARVRVGGAAEAGYLEVATADDGKEPIYVRQYTGNFATVKRTATLLDASGNTTFPGTVTASGFTGYVNGDNYINWGGPNLSSNMSPSDAGCLDENGHNKAAFFGGKITVEYSTDGGTTWTTPKVLTDEEKFRLTTKGGYGVTIGNVTSSGVITSENVTNYLSRITLSSRNASGGSAFYTAMKKLILNVSTNGATGTTVKVETRSIAAYNAGNDTWSTRGSYSVTGWSGYNSIPCAITFGGGSSKTSQIADLRLTMSATGARTSSSNTFNVFDIRIIGVTNWGVNAFASTGHIYDFDYQKNVTFPAKVTARSGFAGNVTGNVTGTASKATADASGNTITTTYATKNELNTGLSSKQGTLTAGTGISITDSTISNAFTSLDSYTTFSEAALNENSSFIYKNTDGAYLRGNFINFVNSIIKPSFATKADLSTKQDTISDLDTIRSGAALGSTALQSVPEEYITESELAAKNYATTTDLTTGLSTKQDTISDLSTIREGAALGATSVQHEDLSEVAISGMYSDLTGTPVAATTDTLGLVKVDGTTITATADGVISAKSSSGFDFEGTKEEFDAAVAAGTITEDSVSLITDDVDGDNLATKAELQAVDRSKADTALSNVLANIDYVIESKFPTEDDPSWYRVYKSGWIEQGGFATHSQGSAAKAVVTFNKPYLNDKYTFTFSGIGAASLQVNLGTDGRTPTGLNVYWDGANTDATEVNWYACGMGAK